MPNLERLLAALAEEVAQGGPGTIPPSLKTLDVRMADAVRTDAAAIFAGILSTLGQRAPYGKPSNLRLASVCSLLGHVRTRLTFSLQPRGRLTIRQ